MAFTLENIVPWGRSFDEYVAMFALSDNDLRRRFLGCGDGPANFNSVLTKRGGYVISVDPLYHYNAKEIRSRIDETYEKVLEQTRKNMNEFVWKHISSVEELGKVRMTAMEEFLSDYETGLKEGRYLEANLPELPFKNGKFDLALCAHFLFLYSVQLSEKFHIRSIKELCRVATEVRIFPLLELGGKKSRYLESVCRRLMKESYKVSIERVAYEFQKGGNEMLRIISA